MVTRLMARAAYLAVYGLVTAIWIPAITVVFGAMVGWLVGGMLLAPLSAGAGATVATVTVVAGSVVALAVLVGLFLREVVIAELRVRPLRSRVADAVTGLRREWTDAADQWPTRRSRPEAPVVIARPVAPAPGEEQVVPRSAPVGAYRAWQVRIEPVPSGGWTPVLASLTARSLWPAPTQRATCDVVLGRQFHGLDVRVPVAPCSCGIYALGEPLDAGGLTHPVVVSGRVLLSGRVIQGDQGFRAEKARITGPLELRLRCSADDCDAPPVGVVVTRSRPEPECVTHLGARDDDDRAEPFAEWSQALRARLEVRYGVDVTVAGHDGEAART
jgi:hypothetical protein